MAASVVKVGIFDMQVCVPSRFSDAEVEEFANHANLAGTANGWRMRTADDRAQAGAPIRVPCAEDKTHVHVMLSC